MKKFGLIFVLYQPTEEFVRNLVRARTVCPNVVAVDNSPEADLRLHDGLRNDSIQVIFNSNKGGLAGAYNRGAQRLLAQDCNIIFLLDQDSEIEDSFFSRMMQAASEIRSDKFLIGPKIYEIKLEKYMPVITPGKRFPKSVHIDEQNEGLFPTLCVISSGAAISAAAYRKLGAFREDYFIEYIDVEYCLRARMENVPVYMNAAVTLRQNNGHIQRHGKLFTTNHTAWRRYYIARNAVHCLRLYRAYSGLHWLSALMALQQAFAVLLFDSQKVKKLSGIACGYLDGLLGRLGTFESRHPRVGAFCRETGHKQVVLDGSSSATVVGCE